ncbi:MAG: UDPglucose 6-dehydrogenase, partial [Ilumatobacteraceae bacterium]|nr:UDPglucose 6-dehydrogenase [Ilumatobacteraceae bacterium]
GPSVALEYGTVSVSLADGMLRLLGELGIVASQRIARTTKSTVDAHWLTITGADQIEDCMWLLEPHERGAVQRQLQLQSKRIAPTGYKRDRKGTAWVRVVDVAIRPSQQTVFSVEVDRNHTVVTTGGLVAHNCFPKDSRALLKIARDAGYHFYLLDGVLAVNEEQFDRVANKIRDAAGGDLAGATVAVWGLTFKARTDDLRDSPAVAIINRLLAAGATVHAHDPTVAAAKAGVPAGITIADSAYAACDGAHVLAVLTEWDEYRWLDVGQVKAAMVGHAVVDARNLLERNMWRRAGFEYQGIGR